MQDLGSEGIVKFKKKHAVSRPERNVRKSNAVQTNQRLPKENEKCKMIKYQQKPVINSARKAPRAMK